MPQSAPVYGGHMTLLLSKELSWFPSESNQSTPLARKAMGNS
jgi:hypothetical protein